MREEQRDRAKEQRDRAKDLSHRIVNQFLKSAKPKLKAQRPNLLDELKHGRERQRNETALRIRIAAKQRVPVSCIDNESRLKMKQHEYKIDMNEEWYSIEARMSDRGECTRGLNWEF